MQRGARLLTSWPEPAPVCLVSCGALCLNPPRLDEIAIPAKSGGNSLRVKNHMAAAVLIACSAIQTRAQQERPAAGGRLSATRSLTNRAVALDGRGAAIRPFLTTSLRARQIRPFPILDVENISPVFYEYVAGR